jgi:hypothetical protein
MTPDEHYLEAEKLLAKAAAGGASDPDRLVARAHVHAILATRAAAPNRTADTSWLDTTLPGRMPTPAPPIPPRGFVPTNEVVDYPGDETDGRR